MLNLRRGSLLAEVLLSVFLIAGCIGLMAGSMQAWERLGRSAEERSGARIQTRAEMERCLATPFDELDSRNTGATPIVSTVERQRGSRVYQTTYQTFIIVATDPGTDIVRIEVRTVFGPELDRVAMLHSVVFKE